MVLFVAKRNPEGELTHPAQPTSCFKHQELLPDVTLEPLDSFLPQVDMVLWLRKRPVRDKMEDFLLCRFTTSSKLTHTYNRWSVDQTAYSHRAVSASMQLTFIELMKNHEQSNIATQDRDAARNEHVEKMKRRYPEWPVFNKRRRDYRADESILVTHEGREPDLRGLSDELIPNAVTTKTQSVSSGDIWQPEFKAATSLGTDWQIPAGYDRKYWWRENLVTLFKIIVLQVASLLEAAEVDHHLDQVGVVEAGRLEGEEGVLIS
ncbi:hypothetical protein FRC03_008628 [Tulasnella sp. 419]|nr:hypothetical protein FRC03_008628 [Tulasnella sp. 419]